MWKKVLAALAALVLLVVAIPFAWGALLPVEHTAASTARYAQSREVVWGVITDTAAYPEWRTGLESVEPLPSGEGWIEHGEYDVIPLEVLASVPPERLETRIVDDDLFFGGTWTYELQPESGATRLTITEHGTVPSAPIRFLSKYLFGHHTTMDQYLVDLGARLGDPVSPTHLQ